MAFRKGKRDRVGHDNSSSGTNIVGDGARGMGLRQHSRRAGRHHSRHHKRG